MHYFWALKIRLGELSSFRAAPPPTPRASPRSCCTRAKIFVMESKRAKILKILNHKIFPSWRFSHPNTCNLISENIYRLVFSIWTPTEYLPCISLWNTEEEVSPHTRPSIYKYFFEKDIFVVAVCVPSGQKRARWRLSNDCWVMYQIHSSWRREERAHTVWMLGGLGEVGVVEVKPEWGL